MNARALDVITFGETMVCFAADEPGLVNGLLDHVARDFRPEEFSKSAAHG